MPTPSRGAWCSGATGTSRTIRRTRSRSRAATSGAARPWTPWLRAGLLHASGDDSATDNGHGTYFPVLPTVRRFSQTTVFSTMNVDDAFVQVMARPVKTLGLRLDVHRLHLASAADLWYIGSGATLEEGAAFGYSGRRSNGSRVLGTSIEASADLAVTPIWSVNAFVGHVDGGRVVTGTFRATSSGSSTSSRCCASTICCDGRGASLRRPAPSR